MGVWVRLVAYGLVAHSMKGKSMHVGTPARARKRRTWTLALLALAALLAGCDAGASAKPTATATTIRIATPTPIPTVLYQADWSKGADGWKLPPHWSIQHGALENDGGGVDAMPIPYTVTVPDYEVDLVARVVNVASPQNCGNLYGMQALDTSGNQLYYAQIYCIGTNPQNPGESLLNVTAGDTGGFATADFALNNDVKTYRVQVHAQGLRFFPNSAAANGGATSSVPLSPATFSLLDQHVQLEVTKFAVLKLNAIGH